MAADDIVVASTTLTGNNESIIGDALRSVVDWVDLCIVVDTGVTDNSLAIARQIAGAKYVERKFQWTNDFAAARNFCLDVALECRANWAVTVDTDERIHLHGEPIRAIMANSGAGALMVSDAARTYEKVRCIRLPSSVRWSGPTHEAFAGYQVGSRSLKKATFSELPKSPEALQRKFERDVAILREHTQKNPKDPRWHFYLGESLKNLKQLQSAVEAYDACFALRGWDEEAAWACYQAASCLVQLQRYPDAIERCARGLTRHAGVAELCWLGGFAAFQSGDWQQAVYWARLSTTLGLFRGAGASVPRIGFRNPMALYEGPYDILRHALQRLGDAAGAAEAERLFQEAHAARLAPRGGDAEFSQLIEQTRALLDAEKASEALLPLERARQLRPNSPVVHNNLGVAYGLLKQREKAIAACRRALELEPQNQLAKNNLAWVSSIP